jgi:bifunctional UDP-N-acetylglucosamine pyrophosphorylase/glucosamine-1-phosphate N-acetyltransferase
MGTSALGTSRRKAVVIMAAGLGTRMKSQLIKVLHPVAGRPMIHYSVRLGLQLGAERVVVVLGHQRERVEAYLRGAFAGEPLFFAEQPEPLGTAHAVSCAVPHLAGFEGDVYILSGDVPNLRAEALAPLADLPGALRLIGMAPRDPAQYGRLVREGDALARIVEFKDCTPAQRAIGEVNAGIYAVNSAFLFDTLGRLGRNNAQGEYYLTDLVQHAHQAGLGASAHVLVGDAAADLLGVNDRVELAEAEQRMQAHLRRIHMRAGVSFIDPARSYLHDGVEIGADTVLEPDVALLGATRVGANCVLEQGVRLVDTTVADDVIVHAYTLSEKAQIGAAAHIGPFARLREGTILGAKVRVGNFVETKKTTMGEGAKANHLSYLGDATIGAKANIGAGTITCNYDGVNKFQTHVGAGAFIGSDTQLVAPVRVGDGAYVGAGTTLTADVPDGALAMTRAPRRTIEGWVERKRQAREAAQKSKTE